MASSQVNPTNTSKLNRELQVVSLKCVFVDGVGDGIKKYCFQQTFYYCYYYY